MRIRGPAAFKAVIAIVYQGQVNAPRIPAAEKKRPFLNTGARALGSRGLPS